MGVHPTPRQRFGLALLAIVAALCGNAYVDYVLLLRNPEELEAVLRRGLKLVLPEYSPEFEALEVTLSERRAVLRGLVLYEQEDPSNVLARVETVEARFSLFPPGLEEVTLIKPQVQLRVAEDGSLNLALGDEETEDSEPTLYTDVQVHVRDARARVISDFEGDHQDLVLQGISVDLTITPDLEVRGVGSARLGALHPIGSPLADLARGPPAWAPAGQRFVDVFGAIDFALEVSKEREVRARVDLGGAELNRALRQVIPPLFREQVWDALGPQSGRVSARVRVGVREDDGVRVNVTVRPEEAAMALQAFPVPITDIAGEFQVAVVIPPGASGPEHLAVSWETVTASVGDGGTAWSRGAVFPGRAHEEVTFEVYVDARDVSVGERFGERLPADIGAVYRLFSPEGTVQQADVVVFRGPHMEEPQISVTASDLGGTLRATYVDYPVPLDQIEGTFVLREGANVQVQARGALQGGGEAEVEAMVLEGELLHVKVDGRRVPVGPELIGVLAPATRRFVDPFDVRSGVIDFHVEVSKPGPADLAVPEVRLVLDEVVTVPEAFAYPLTVSGVMDVTPRFAPDASDDDDIDDEPQFIDLVLALDLSAEGIEGGRVDGPLRVDPTNGDFTAELTATASAVTLLPDLVAALPADLGPRLLPRGVARGIQAQVRRLDDFDLRAEGDGLGITVDEFPYPLKVERFEVGLGDGRLTISEGVARPEQNGAPSSRLVARGVVGLEGELAGQVDLRVEGTRIPVDGALLAALPEETREDVLAPMDPRGWVDVEAELHLGPGRTEGTVLELELSDVQARFDHLAPALRGYGGVPLGGGRGGIRVELPDLVELRGLRGQIDEAEVVLDGRIETAPWIPYLWGGVGVVLGELVGWLGGEERPELELAARVVGVQVDESRRERLPDDVKPIWDQYPVRGTLDLELGLTRRPWTPTPSMNARITPRGMQVTPSWLQVPLDAVEGWLEVDDQGLERIDLRARLGETGRVRVRHDALMADSFPGGGERGKVFSVVLRDFGFPVEEAEREALWGGMDAARRDLVEGLNPQGGMDVAAWLYVPDDERLAYAERVPLSWVAELRPRSLALSAGLDFEEIHGVVRAAGRVPELGLGSFEGELSLEQVAWKEQVVYDLRGPVRLEDGVLSVGVRGSPFTGRLYDGQLAGISELSIPTGAYQGWVDLRASSVATAARELARLQEEPAEAPPPSEGEGEARPLTGQIYATLAFEGGAVDASGTPTPIYGEGSLHVANSNLVLVPVLGRIVDAFRDEDSQPLAFETMHMDYVLLPDRFELGSVRLDSPALVLVADRGSILYGPDPRTNGTIEVTFVPFDTGSVIAQRIFETNLLPLTGYQVSGKLWDPNVSTGLIFFNEVQRLFRSLTEDE